MEHDRQLIIYPEGTRRAPGDEPAYKYGIVELYAQLGMPVVPVAHVAGLYWPRRKFMRYAGTIKARFLKPIEAGLDREEFIRRLVARNRGGLRRTADRRCQVRKPAAVPPTAVQRLKELGVVVDGHPHAALASSSSAISAGAELQRSGADQAVDLRQMWWRWRSAR